MAERVFRVLGSLRVEIDDRVVAVASATQRRLLAVLLAQPDVVVSVDRLADAVWDGNPPASSRASLQTYLYRLRSAIGDEVIVTRPPGYLLDSSTFSCDAQQFEELAFAARSADTQSCIDLSGKALALWRGPAFAEFEHTFSCRPAALRLQELRLSLMERRIEALLSAGSPDRAIAESEALCAAEPLRELAHANLMRALAVQGRMPEALRVFDGFRRYLAEEIGLAPTIGLQELAHNLIQQTNLDVEALERQAIPEFPSHGPALRSHVPEVAETTSGDGQMLGAIMHVVMVPPPSAIEFSNAANLSALSEQTNLSDQTDLSDTHASDSTQAFDAAKARNRATGGALMASSLQTELARRSIALIREVVRNGGGVPLLSSTGTMVGTGAFCGSGAATVAEHTDSSGRIAITCWFSSSVEAVLTGIELQQVFAKDGQRHGDASVGLGRVGVSFGHVQVTGNGLLSRVPTVESTVSGTPVLESVGLAAIASAGVIVVSAQTVLGIQHIDGLAFETLPRQHIQGLGEPESPSIVVWDRFPNLANRLGLPARLTLRPGGLVGRETTLEPLLNCLDSVEQGEPMLVSLIGAPGIGKTSLVAAFAEHAMARGCAVLFGSCRRDPNMPYQAISAAFEDFVRRHPGGARILGPYRAEFANLLRARDLELEAGLSSRAHAVDVEVTQTLDSSVPDSSVLYSTVPNVGISVDVSPGDAQTRRSQTFEAVTQVICTLSDQLPILFILDDLHWVDPATVELLEEFLAGVRGHRVLVLVALREYESVANTRLAQLYQSVASLIPSRRISVQGISVDAVASFVRQVHGAATPGLAESVHARTSGNPFLVGELLANFSTAGMPMDGKSNALSARLVDALAGRLGTVGEPCRRLLSVAAVAGSEFDPVVVAAAIDAPQDTVFDLFDEAVASGNLRERSGEELRLGFDHELLRESLLAGMTQLRRKRHHRDIGLAIERRHPTVRNADLSDLARHFSEAATLGETGRACTYNTLAAERSLLTNGDVQAIGYFRSALEFCDEEVARAEIMVGLGEALRRRGDRSYRGVLSDAASIADANDAIELMARAVLTDNRGTFGIAFDVDEPRVKRLRRAIDRLGNSSPATLARLLAALAVELVWSPAWQESLTLSDQAVDLARSLGDGSSDRDEVGVGSSSRTGRDVSETNAADAVLAEVLQLRQWVVFYPLERRLQETRELDALTAHSLEPVARFESAAHATFTYLTAADPLGLEQSLELARWLARRIDRPATEWMLCVRESSPAMLACRFEEAAALIARSFELGTQTAQPDAFLQRSVQTFWLEFETVDGATQRADMLKLSKYADKMPVLSWPSLAFRFADLGMLTEAEAMFRLVRATTGELPLDQVWLWNTCQMASLSARFAPELREKYLMDLAPHGGQIATTVFASVGPVDRYVGQLRASVGDVEIAEREFLKAIDVATSMSAASWKARTQLDLADLVSSLGRESEAAVLRERAAEVAANVGLPVVADRAAMSFR
jgi:DNA-binding SARP family transcriptional activator